MIKIGRRGSMNVRVTVKGIQGHVGVSGARAQSDSRSWPSSSRGSSSWTLDDGSEHFEPSTLAFTTVDVGNPAVNVIPAEARAGFNIRFNDLAHAAILDEDHRGASRATVMRAMAARSRFRMRSAAFRSSPSQAHSPI